ncbi:MAG: gamma-glutamylcyclotransferase family protein [Rhodothermus sp.]|nr:gamma-glutamylcyclotransferase family protein [Rhodothermus sp.]
MKHRWHPPAWMPVTLLFVYGTLRGQLPRFLPPTLHEAIRSLGRACYRGRLYDLGAYSGAVPDPDGLVHGELYALQQDQAARIFAYLDEYEGYDPDRPEAGEYRRVQDTVFLPDGHPVSAWIYLYHGDLSQARLISSGDYLRDRSLQP